MTPPQSPHGAHFMSTECFLVKFAPDHCYFSLPHCYRLASERTAFPGCYAPGNHLFKIGIIYCFHQ